MDKPSRLSAREQAYELPAAVKQAISVNRFTLVGFGSSEAEEILSYIWKIGGFARAQDRLPEPADPCDLIIVDSRALEGISIPSYRPTIVVGPPSRLATLTVEPGSDFMVAPVDGAELLLRCRNLLTRRRDPGARTQRANGQAPRVLVGAFDPVTTALLEMTFEHSGMDCAVVTSGDQVLNQALEWKPDTILLTVDLPEKNGFDVLDALKHDMRTESLPVLFLTPDRQEANVLRAFALGASDLVTTPFSPLELVARVKRLQADH